MKKLLLIITLVSLVFVFSNNVKALESPTSLSIDDITVYRHVYELNDILFEFRYNINYGEDEPAEASEDTFAVSLRDTTGSIILGGVNTTHYNESVDYIYAEAGHSFAWGSAYVVNLEGPLASGIPSQSRTISTSDYIAESNVLDTRASFKTNFVALVRTLQQARRDTYNDDTIEYITDTPQGPILSPDGENFFLKSIPSLSVIVPQIFVSAVVGISITPTPGTSTYAESLIGLLDGTDFKQYAVRIESTTGMSTLMFTSFFVIVLYGVFVMLMTIKFRKVPQVWIVIGMPILVWGTYSGLLHLAALAAMLTILAVSASYYLFFRRAG